MVVRSRPNDREVLLIILGPLARRVLSWLVGWRYDGGPDARRRLVAELPVVAFRPRTGE